MVAPMKGYHKISKTVPRETFDLKEENFETEENIKICCTQMKKESSFKGTIVFMQPDYYKADLKTKKNILVIQESMTRYRIFL